MADKINIDVEALYQRLVILKELEKVDWLGNVKGRIHEELVELEESLKPKEEPKDEAGYSDEQPVQQPEGSVPAA